MRVALLVGFVFSAPASAEPSVDARHVEVIKRAAKAYVSWGKVDDQSRLAPTLCAPPPSPSKIRLSAADAESPHGKKLYYLWASDRAKYLDSKQTIPVGFSIVKQSFAAVPAAATATAKAGSWTVGPAKDVFVMVRVGDNTPGSDDGWVYGTVSPDGTVTSAGRVATCMGCHDQQTSRDKLFGLAK